MKTILNIIILAVILSIMISALSGCSLLGAGERGERGEQGERGYRGTAGKSAYELAVENGFKGNLQDWLDSLKGGNGVNDADGSEGLTGPEGPAGLSGIDIQVVRALDVFTFKVFTDLFNVPDKFTGIIEFYVSRAINMFQVKSATTITAALSVRRMTFYCANGFVTGITYTNGSDGALLYVNPAGTVGESISAFSLACMTQSNAYDYIAVFIG